jgi:Membrane-associated phospholipid phosphatase
MSEERPLPPPRLGPFSRLKARIRRAAVRWVNWLGGLEPASLMAVLVLLVAGWIFIELADSIADGETLRFDPWLLRALRTKDDPAIPIGPWWVSVMARDCTSLGGYFCLILFTAVTAGYLYLDQKKFLSRFLIASALSGYISLGGYFCLILFTAVTAGYLYLDQKKFLSRFLIASALSGYIVSTVLKMTFQRARPDLVPHLDVVASSSFPSGHSMNAAVVYLTLGTLLATAARRQRLKVYVIGVALFITVMVGLSRIYLGVHYPTDVLAGWMAGLVWAILCYLVARILQKRRKLQELSSEGQFPDDRT